MGWIFVVIYFLMWLLVTFVTKYIDKKCECCNTSNSDDNLPAEAMGFFWPIVVSLAVIAGIYYIFILIGKGMDKLIDEITKNTK